MRFWGIDMPNIFFLVARLRARNADPLQNCEQILDRQGALLLQYDVFGSVS
jgi:hypothetical protein